MGSPNVAGSDDFVLLGTNFVERGSGRLSSRTTCCSDHPCGAARGIISSTNFPGDLAAERRAFYAKEFATKVTRLARLLSDAATT